MKRLLLTCCVTVTFGLASGAWAASPGPLPPAADQSLARDLFKELVEINTTHDHGSTQAAEAIQRHLLDAGFPAADVVLIAPPGHPTKGNVVVRYHGRTTASRCCSSATSTSWKRSRKTGPSIRSS